VNFTRPPSALFRNKSQSAFNLDYLGLPWITLDYLGLAATWLATFAGGDQSFLHPFAPRVATFPLQYFKEQPPARPVILPRQSAATAGGPYPLCGFSPRFTWQRFPPSAFIRTLPRLDGTASAVIHANSIFFLHAGGPFSTQRPGAASRNPI
jgi:hypothetical protein